MDCGSHCAATARHFGNTVAEKDLERYLREGPDITTRLLLSSLRGSASKTSTLLDVGGGIGAASFELLAAGIDSATLVDASPSYLQMAGVEAQRRKVEARLNLVLGDFAKVVDRLNVADIVVLDRVVCCYPDYVALLETAVARCRSLLALSYPRDTWYGRAMVWVENLLRRVKGDEFRAFVHPAAGLEAIVQEAGFRRLSRRSTWVWRADVYTKARVA
jgi:2-polyprenyl-3-methyl-5-hydroxy-6-metoxy-1,4-benzoquinol methylase